MGSAISPIVLNGEFMSLYHRYMVCYDIVDNKTRTRFMNTLKNLGLFAIQKSVFIGELNQAEIRSLAHYAHKHLDSEEDKAFWLPTSIDEKRLKDGVGYNTFSFIKADGHASI